MRELEAENARLKKAVAELTVDKIIRKEVLTGRTLLRNDEHGGRLREADSSFARNSGLVLPP